MHNDDNNDNDKFFFHFYEKLIDFTAYTIFFFLSQKKNYLFIRSNFINKATL